MPALDGILLVDKPEGYSSTEVVRVLKKARHIKKIGHLGTLDPFASGLLPICIGAGSKLSQFLMAARKSYEGTLQLGVETDTLDCTGTITRTVPVPPDWTMTLQEMERRFDGEYWQTPPMYSALKRNGVPLYKLARRGLEIKREPRKVHLAHLTLTQGAADTIHFSVSCSKGTYIRVLAADLAATLDCVAHVTRLRRTAFGSFSIDQAVPLSLVEKPEIEPSLPLLSLVQATQCYRTFSLPARAVALLQQGQQAVLQELPTVSDPTETVRILGPNKELVAFAGQQEGFWRLVRVF